MRIARELSAAPLGEFVGIRGVRAKEAADRELAGAIKALRKPSVAAWVVNVFAQEHAGELGEALRLAEELRAAQADLDAPALAKLGKERRTLTRRLAEDAAALAEARGEKVTPATLESVQQTISAAFFDERASLAVASGRLVRELEPSADIDLDDVVAGGAPAKGATAPGESTDELAARRRRRQAERAVNDAEEAVAAAERTRDGAETACRNAARRIEEFSAAAADLEKQLVHLRREGERARDAAAAANEQAAVASREIVKAARLRDEAQKALDSL